MRCLVNAMQLSCTELGHGIHDLLSRTSYVKFHGHRSPPDFAEAPSVMLENWCWMKDELKQMSCHYTKIGHKNKNENENVDDDNDELDNMLDNLIKSYSLNRTMWYLNQL